MFSIRSMSLTSSLVHYETENPHLVQGFTVSSVIIDKQTAYQRVRIYNTPAFGKVLVLDDETQSAARDEKVYHESLVHPVMSTFGGGDAPRRILIIGGGEGATAREVLRYSCVEKVTMIDIDAELIEICKCNLPEWSAGAFEDPRLQLIATDAFTWLHDNPTEQFDLIIIDLCDPDPTDPDNQINRFYTEEFAREMSNRSKALVMQCGDYESMNKAVDPYFHAFGREKCHTYTVFIPSFTSMWGFVVCYTVDLLIPENARLPDGLEHMSAARLKALMTYDFLAFPGYKMSN